MVSPYLLKYTIFNLVICPLALWDLTFKDPPKIQRNAERAVSFGSSQLKVCKSDVAYSVVMHTSNTNSHFSFAF